MRRDGASEASGRERDGMTSQQIGEVMSDTEAEQVEQTDTFILQLRAAQNTIIPVFKRSETATTNYSLTSQCFTRSLTFKLQIIKVVCC